MQQDRSYRFNNSLIETNLCTQGTDLIPELLPSGSRYPAQCALRVVSSPRCVKCEPTRGMYITYQHSSLEVDVPPSETRVELTSPVPVSLGEDWGNFLSSPPIGWLEGDVTSGHRGQ